MAAPTTVKDSTSLTINCGQVAVTSSAGVLIAAANPNRTKLTILSSVPVFIADTAVGAANGFPPFGTNAVQGVGPYDIPTQDAVYAQSVGGAGVVFFAEFHN